MTLLILAGAGLALLATTDRIGKPTDADPPNVKEIGRAGIISS